MKHIKYIALSSGRQTIAVSWRTQHLLVQLPLVRFGLSVPLLNTRQFILYCLYHHKHTLNILLLSSTVLNTKHLTLARHYKN